MSGSVFGSQNAAMAATHAILLVGVGSRHAVLEFPAGVNHPKPVGSITKGIVVPFGLATDAHGTLYVLNHLPSNVVNVQVYAAGSNTPSRTLSVPGGGSSIAVGPDGSVFVEGYVPGAEDGVFEYAPGATKPSFVVNAPSSPPVGFGPIAVDASDNLYVTFAGGSCCGSGVYKYPPMSQNGVFYNGSYGGYGAMAFVTPTDLLIASPYTKKTFIRVVHPAGRTVRFDSPPAIALAYDDVDNLLYTAFGTVAIVDYTTKKVVGAVAGIYDATSLAVSASPY